MDVYELYKHLCTDCIVSQYLLESSLSTALKDDRSVLRFIQFLIL